MGSAGERRRVAASRLCAALLLAALAGCGGEEVTQGSNPTPPKSRSGPLSWTTPDAPFECLPLTGHCLSPMPSNLFTRRDPTTPTGIRVNLTEHNYSEGIFQYASQFLPPSLLNAADGFSPAAQIVVSLPVPADPGSLPSSLEASVRIESPVLLLETPSWRPVPYYIWVDPEGPLHKPPQYFLVLIPARPLATATTYAVIVTKALRAKGGGPMPPYPVFERIKNRPGHPAPLADKDEERLRELYAAFLDSIEQATGMQRQEILLAFDFTTRSEGSLFAPMLCIRDEVKESARIDPPRFSLRHIVPPLLEPSEACEILGTYQSPSFRTEGDKVLALDEQGLPHTTGKEDITLLLKLPKVPQGTKVPVVIFGHGLWVSKETVFQVSEDLLQAGFAIAAIDAACHGSRIPRDGFIGDLFQIETVMRATACLAQTVADELHLVELLRGELARLDLLPCGPAGCAGDGVPDLDTDRLYYLGQSMGTVLGLTFTALCPEIRAAVLNVPGCGIVHIVTQGTITRPAVGRQFIPTWTPPLDASLLYISGQMYVDYLDPIHFGRFIDTGEPGRGTGPRAILLQEAIGDGLIPNWDTDILARALGVPVAEPSVYVPYGVAFVPTPARGSAVFQYAFTDNPFLAHLLMLLVPESRLQITRFFSSCEQGSPVICNPFE